MLAQEPGGPNSYQNAIFFVRAGRFEEAVPALQTMLRSEPQNLKARNLLGLALTGSGQLQSANHEFLTILKRDSSFVPALKNLGINEYSLGQTISARIHLRKALQLTPNDEVASLYLRPYIWVRLQLRNISATKPPGTIKRLVSA